MDLKVLLVVLSFAAVVLAAGPNSDVKSQGYNVHGQKSLQSFGGLSSKQPQDAAQLLQRWCKSSQMSQDATTQSFKQLIESLKQTSAQQLDQLTQQVVINERICQSSASASSSSSSNSQGNSKQQYIDAGSEDLIKDVYMDALIGAETRDSMRQLLRCIDSGKVDKIRANFYLTRLALADESSVSGKDNSIVMELIESLMKPRSSSGGATSAMSRELADAIERQKMFAATAALAKSANSKQQPDKAIERMAEQITKTIAERYIYTTSTAQQQQQQQEDGESAEKKADRQAALKAIGNVPSAYYPKEIVQLLLKLASASYESSAVRQSAIEALEQCDEARTIVKSIIKDAREPAEVRIAAYRCLMSMSVTIGDIDELIALVSDSRRQVQDKQLVMYIVSHLNNVRNTNNRDYQQIVDILHANKQHYMAVQLLAKKFSHMQDMRKYSRNYQLEQTFGKIESGLIVESDLIYGSDNESKQQRGRGEYLPKLLRLNVSMPVFGKNVNVMEIALRQHNMEEQIVRSMPMSLTSFGKDGGDKFSMETLERIVDAIKTVAKESEQQQQKQQQQQKKSYNNNNSNKYEQQQQPEADLSIKVDGCTVLYVSLDDFKSINEATTGDKRIRRDTTSSAFEDVLDAMKKSFAFNRGAHFAINKRLAGILDIDAVLSGALRVESRVHSMGADQFEIVAHVQPRFAFEAIVGPSSVTKRVLQRISTESSVAVHMKYSRSELIEVQLDLPMAEMELFKFQTDIVEQTTDGSYKYIRSGTKQSSMRAQQQGRHTTTNDGDDDDSDDDEYDVYSDNVNSNKFINKYSKPTNKNKWSLKGKQQQTDNSKQYYAKQLEMPSKLVRALGLDAKIELVYSASQMSYLARCVVNKVEPSMQGYRFQIQSQKSNNQQQQQYAIVMSTPGASSQVDRNIQMRVLKQTTPQRVIIKTDLMSSFAAGSAQLELVRDERQVALRVETISRQGKAAKLELGFQQSAPVMSGKKQLTLKPYMTIVVPNQAPMRFDGVLSIQQGPKTVIAYDFKMPEQLFSSNNNNNKRSQIGGATSQQGQAQFVRGKIIADIDDVSTSATTKFTSGTKQRRSMSSPLERAIYAQDVTISSETIAQLGSLALKVHAMLESKAQESVGVELSTQYQLMSGAHSSRAEQSKFAAKLHYQAPRGQQQQQQQRQALYVEHSCTAHPEHAFLFQLNHAYKPQEQQDDLSIDVHYAGSSKRYSNSRYGSSSNKQISDDNSNKEQVSYSHQLKFKPDTVECVFAIKATPIDYEREAKLMVQSDKLRYMSSSSSSSPLSAKFQSLRNPRTRMTPIDNDDNDQGSLKAQLIVVDTLKKETTVEARYEMSDYYKSVLASLKLSDNNGNTNKRQYRVSHQVRRDTTTTTTGGATGTNSNGNNKSSIKFNNKLQLDFETKHSEIEYVLRADKLARGVHELTVDGVYKSNDGEKQQQQQRRPIAFESKTRVQYERDIGVEHKTQTTSGADFQLELVCKPQQGIYKVAHQSDEYVVDMMARVMPNPEPVKQIQWQVKQRRGAQFVHQTKVIVDEREQKLIVQSQQQKQQSTSRNNNKQSYKVDALFNWSSAAAGKQQQQSYLQAVWGDNNSNKASIEYVPETGHFQSQLSTRSIAHKTVVDVQQQQQQSRRGKSTSMKRNSFIERLFDDAIEISVQSRTDKYSKLVCDIQAQLSSHSARQQVSMSIPKWYDIKLEAMVDKAGDNKASSAAAAGGFKQVRCVAKKGQENKSDKGYEQYQAMMDVSAWPINTKFECDATDASGRRRVSFAADMWAQHDKPSTFALQSPTYVAQSELVYGGSHDGVLRAKGTLKNLERNERYQLDTGLAIGSGKQQQRSHFTLETPEHKSLAFFEPQTQSGEFNIDARQHKSSPWSLKAKFDSERDSDSPRSFAKSIVGRYVRRASVDYDDEHEQHHHLFQYTPSVENVKFMSERRFKSQSTPYYKLQTDVSSYRNRDTRDKASMFNLESANYDADFIVKPFGDEQRAAWKIRARRSINEGELYATKRDNGNNDKKDKLRDSKTYKAMMKHLSDKQLKALLESECSSSAERCKSKLHVPNKFTTRYEHDFDYNDTKHHSTTSSSSNNNNNKPSSRFSKFNFELDAPERKFSHMSSFEMERPRSAVWRHKRATTYGSDNSQLISLRKNLENMNARIKSKTVYNNNDNDNDEQLYDIEAQLNQGLYDNSNNNNKKPLSSFKFNAPQWRSEMQYEPESYAQFEFVTPEQRRHLTRFEPIIGGNSDYNDMLKFTSKSFNKRGNEEYQMQGQFPSQYLSQYLNYNGKYTDNNNKKSNNANFDDAMTTSIDQSQSGRRSTKFDYQDDSYKAGFDFDNERTQWYMKNAQSGFEHQTKLARYPQQATSKQQQQQQVLSTITKSARFGTLASIDVSVSPADKSMTINMESALIKGTIVAQFPDSQDRQQSVVSIKYKFENQANFSEQVARELVREYLSHYSKSTGNSGKFARSSGSIQKRVAEKLETLVIKLAQSAPFKHESEFVCDTREQAYKYTTQFERHQQVVLDASLNAKLGRQTVARCNTRHVRTELSVDHKSGSMQVRSTGTVGTDANRSPFTHETIVEKVADASHLYAIQSRTTYKQRELATIVGRVAVKPYHSGSTISSTPASQLDATLFEAQYRVMARQAGDLVKLIVEDNKRGLVHDKEFKYDAQRERVEFQCRTTSNKYNNNVVYKAQGVVSLDSDNDQVSHIVFEIVGDNKQQQQPQQFKAQYVPKKELNIAFEGPSMKHMTKLELARTSSPSSSSSWRSAVKQMKVRSYTKSPQLAYDIDANIDCDTNTQAATASSCMYKIKAQAFGAKDRQVCDLIVVNEPQQRSYAKLSTRHLNAELVGDHKADTVEVRADYDNKKYTHHTQVQRIDDGQSEEYIVRSVTNYKSQQLAKVSARVTDGARRFIQAPRAMRTGASAGVAGELEAALFNQQYKVIAHAQPVEGGKMHKYTLNVDDNKRNIVSQNTVVYDGQREQIVFESRVADKYQQASGAANTIYQASGRISAQDEQTSEIKYVSQRSQMSVEYKPKKAMLIDIVTPAVKHSTKLIMPNTQVASRTPWKSAFQQMNLSSSLDAQSRSSPYKPYAYNFDADFDVHRKPSMFAIKLH